MILPQNTRLSIFPIFLFILYLTPVIGICWFVARFSVNVPLFDQWILPYLFEKFATDDLTLKTLLAQHNTHRLFFPKLIFISLAFLSNWNIRLELCFSVGLAIFTSLALYQLSRITSQFRSNFSFHLANIFTYFLIFSWVQYENWLWGFQIAIFLINLCVVLACLVLVDPKLKSKFKLFIAAVLCGVASFSSAQGLLSWIVVLPLVAILDGNSSQKIKRLMLWVFTFILSGLIYSIDYQKESTFTEENLLIHLDQIWSFFLNLIAAPIFHSTTLNSWIGGLILLLFLGLTSNWIKHHSSSPQKLKSLTWISIGFFSILCSALIAIGRAELGTDYALVASRYTTHSILLLIACVQLAQRWADDSLNYHRVSLNLKKLLVYSFLVGILISFNGMISLDAMSYIQSRLPLIQGGRTCFYLINYLEKSSFFKTSLQSCLLQLNPRDWIDVIWDTAPRLERLNFRKFAKNVTFISQPELVDGEITSPLTSEQSLRISSGDSIHIEGWITLSRSQKLPEIIFFSQADHQSFFANADVIPENNDFKNLFNIQSQTKAKWQIELSAHDLSIEPTVISAWSYHSEKNQFHKLKNDVNIIIEPIIMD